MPEAHHLATRPVKAIVIHCPSQMATLQAVVAGAEDALERDPAVARMLAIIRAPNAFGDFGRYQGVIEIGLGLETFIASAQSRPTLGAPGSSTWSPTITLTTYVDEALPDGELQDVLREIMAAHPWETPVIEVRASRLLLR